MHPSHHFCSFRLRQVSLRSRQWGSAAFTVVIHSVSILHLYFLFMGVYDLRGTLLGSFKPFGGRYLGSLTIVNPHVMFLYR